MHIAKRLFDTGASANLTHLLMIPPSWTNPIKLQNVPQSQIAVKRLLSVDGLIFLDLHIGQLSNRISFELAPHPVVEILHRTSFIDRSIFGNFYSKLKVVS